MPVLLLILLLLLLLLLLEVSKAWLMRSGWPIARAGLWSLIPRHVAWGLGDKWERARLKELRRILCLWFACFRISMLTRRDCSAAPRRCGGRECLAAAVLLVQIRKELFTVSNNPL